MKMLVPMRRADIAFPAVRRLLQISSCCIRSLLGIGKAIPRVDFRERGGIAGASQILYHACDRRHTLTIFPVCFHKFSGERKAPQGTVLNSGILLLRPSTIS